MWAVKDTTCVLSAKYLLIILHRPYVCLTCYLRASLDWIDMALAGLGYVRNCGNCAIVHFGMCVGPGRTRLTTLWRVWIQFLSSVYLLLWERENIIFFLRSTSRFHWVFQAVGLGMPCTCDEPRAPVRRGFFLLGFPPARVVSEVAGRSETFAPGVSLGRLLFPARFFSSVDVSVGANLVKVSRITVWRIGLQQGSVRPPSPWMAASLSPTPSHP